MDILSLAISFLGSAGAELELDEIFIIVFICLVIFSLLIGYLLGRRVTDSEAKKTKKAEKKAKKLEEKDKKELEKLEKEEAKESKKLARKQDKKQDKNDANNPDVKWVDTEDLDTLPSAMPIVPEESSSIYIPKRSEDSPAARPVVSAPRRKPQTKADSLKADAQAEADTRKAERAKAKAVKKEDERANALAERLNSNIEESKTTTPKEEPKEEKKGLFSKKKAKEQTAEAPVPEEKVSEPEKAKEPKKEKQPKETKISKKSAKKQKQADLEELDNTVQVEADENSEPVTAEEMAKRLESVLGTGNKPAVTLGAAEEEIPVENIGEVELSVQPGITDAPVAFDPLEETRRLNADAEKKEAERKEKAEETLPSFAFGAGVESSADDVQLSSKQRKKLQKAEEEAEKAKEEAEKKKSSFSLFNKKKEEEEAEEVEDDFEGWQEEIPDSLAGFGFTAAPAMNDPDKKDE